MRTLGGRPASIAIGIATAIVIVAVAIIPFLTPAWIGFEQGRAQAQAWTGYSEADLRTATNAILADLVVGPPDFDVAIAGVPVLNDRERGHMRDVRTVFGGLAIAAVVSVIVLLHRGRSPEGHGRQLAGRPAGRVLAGRRGRRSGCLRARRVRHALRGLPRGPVPGRLV